MYYVYKSKKIETCHLQFLLNNYPFNIYEYFYPYLYIIQMYTYFLWVRCITTKIPYKLEDDLIKDIITK